MIMENRIYQLFLIAFILLIPSQIKSQENALHFTRANSEYVDCGNDASFAAITGAFSLSAWVNVDAIGNTMWVQGSLKTAGTTTVKGGYSLAVHSSGKVRFGLRNNGSQSSFLEGTTVLTPGVWYHIVGTYDGATQRVYVNGVEENFLATTIVVNVSNQVSYTIGALNHRDDQVPVNYFDGIIDESSVWGLVLTPAQINQLMCQKLDGTEAGLVAHYSLDEGAGTLCTDLSPNTNDGTTQNGPTWVSGINPVLLPDVNANASQTLVCQGDMVTFTGTGSTLSNSSYSWDNSVTDGVPFSTSSTTLHTVTRSLGTVCQNTDTITVNVIPEPVITMSSTSVCVDGTITLTPNSGGTWVSNNTGVATVTAGGVVTLVSDGNVDFTFTESVNSCSNTTATLTVNPLPSVVANASQLAVCDGDPVTLTGSGAVSYTWDNSVTDGVAFTPASTTLYTVTGTDGNSCQNTDTITVHVNSLPAVVANASQATICDGDLVTLTGSGAVSYTWNNSVTDGIAFTSSSTTLYTVTGTDGNSCENTDTITVHVNPSPTITISDTVICVDGSITLTPNSGGTWVSNNVGVATVTAGGVVTLVSNGNVDFTFTESVNSCSNTTVTLTVNPLPLVVANASQMSICDGDSVVLYGAGAGSYTWDNSVTDSVAFMPSNTTLYTVIGTDSNSCQNTDTITQFVNPLPVVVANASQTIICDEDSVLLNGSGAASYVWDNSVTDSVSFAPSSTALYTVIGTDTNSCENIDTITVYVNPLPAVTISTTSECVNGSVTLTPNSGGTWVSNNVGVATITPGGVVTLENGGTVDFTFTESVNSCSNTTPVLTVQEPPVLANATQTTICPGGSVTLTGSGAVSYVWDKSITDGLAFVPTYTDSYVVTGTDGSGCISTDTIVIVVDSCINAGGGLALRFSGSEYVNCGSSTIGSNPSITTSAWVKVDALGSTMWIQGKMRTSGGTQGGYSLAVHSSGVFKFGVRSPSASNFIDSKTTVIPDVWYHVTGTFDNITKEQKLYVNGILDTMEVFSGGFISSITSVNYTIGCLNNGPGNYINFFTGEIDESALWSRVLSGAEIKATMCNTSVITSGLEMHFNMNEGVENSCTSGSDICNNPNGDPTFQGTFSASAPSWVMSTAPLGDFSTYLYPSGGWNGTHTLSFSNLGDNLNLLNVAGNPRGIQIYKIAGYPNVICGSPGIGINNRFFGVFVTDPGASYDVDFNYIDDYPRVNDSICCENYNTLGLATRMTNDTLCPAWSTIGGLQNIPALNINYTGFTTNQQEIILTSVGAVNLPIKLIEFKGKNIGNSNLVEWKTASEINNDYFIIERSRNGFEWDEHSRQKGKINSNELNFYSVLDENPFNGITYYRLKQVDFNGEFSYSEIIKIKSFNDLEVMVYPNPTNGNIQIEFDDVFDQATITIRNVFGQTVSVNEYVDLKNVNTKINGENGLYFIEVKTPESTINLKVLKQ